MSYTQGIHRVSTGFAQMFWPFKRKKRAAPAPEPTEIERRIAALEASTATIREAMVEEQSKAFAFRGRVYAYLGRKGVKLTQEGSLVDDPERFDWTRCPVDDPRLTKAQVKQRLNLTTAASQARRLKPN